MTLVTGIDTLMSQLWGVIALRLANAEILPFDFESYGMNIRKFVRSLDAASHITGKIDLVSLEGIRFSGLLGSGRA